MRAPQIKKPYLKQEDGSNVFWYAFGHGGYWNTKKQAVKDVLKNFNITKKDATSEVNAANELLEEQGWGMK